uniref:CSON006638 protein n=1 Tax=Culicoides sonorensis TaxID=179676 RepID=A0A336KBX9_CULSO
MSLLKYSRTWPSIIASTMAVVQIRVDPKGRPFSSIISSTVTNSNINNNNNNVENHQRHAVQTPSEQVIEIEPTHQEQIQEDLMQNHAIPVINIVSPYTSIETNDTQLCSSHLLNRLHVPNGGKFCYCSTERRLFTNSTRPPPSYLRSESIKVDNWDYIYTERKEKNGDFRSSQLDNNFNEHKHVNGCVSGLAALKASTLQRHYYPEGNWGWVIVVVAIINIILTHGLQLSASLFLLPAGVRFHQNYVNSAVV